ncbi:hypothetical protein HHI36_023337 [Cryptolaemus montrouzieri]|uniref:Uncharacterized protein n=1 Tax=Cryptolaemus montrouzieri TaxID=559131 RepID=A0ABD2PG20_9CUCU
MKYYIYFVAYIYLKVNVGASFLSNHGNLENYLNEKMETLSLKEEVRVKRNTSEYNIDFLDFHDHKDAWKFAYSFTLFNESYVMLDKDFWKLFMPQFLTFLTLTPILEAVEEEMKITMAKIIEFEELGIMFVVLNNKYVRIIKFEDRNVRKYQDVQTIGHVSVSGVSFFLNRGKLYLIISNERINNVAPVSIYLWKHGQFDEIHTIFLRGISKLTTFQDEEREIILLMQEKKNQTSFCHVYEFENDYMNKKQVIGVEGPRFMLTYKIENEKYVLFLNNHTGLIYKWNGFQLLQWSTQTITSQFERTLVMYMNNSPLIFGTYFDKYDVYKPTSEKLEFLKTKEYRHNFTEIFDIEYVIKNGSTIIIVAGNIEDTGMIEGFKIRVSETDQEKVLPMKDPLQSCLSSLDNKLKDHETHTDIHKKSSILFQNGTARTMASYSMSSRNHEIKDIEIEDKVQEIEEKYSFVSGIIENFQDEEEIVRVNGQLLIEETLTAGELTAANIDPALVNNKQWSPNQWLSYSQNQTLSGTINANVLTVLKLETTPEVTIFKDLFLNNSNSRIHGSFTVQSLSTDRLYANEINNIKKDDIFMRNRDSIVTGKKIFTHLTADSVEAIKIRNNKSQDVIEQILASNNERTINFASHVFIEDLEVEDIDNVNWNTFKHSVFRYGVTKAITGNLKIKSFETTNLNVVSLNGINVNNFLTTLTDQNISSSIEFSSIFAPNITANRVNGISLADEAATVNNPSITGPVTIENIHILGDLIANSSLMGSSFLKKNQHIVGTEESDLLQIYTDEVKIVGNLRVKNLRISNTSSVFLSSGKEEFSPFFVEKYWMKNINQIVPVFVVAQEGLTTPHLQTKLLNGHGMFNYMMNNTNKTLPTNLAFDNVTFLGNVYLNSQKTHIPDLQKIDRESVKLNGSFVISGKTLFKDSVKIISLHADKLNNIEKEKLVTTESKNIKFAGKKTFENLQINGNFNTNLHSSQKLNGVELNRMMENAVYINQPQTLKSLNFTSVSFENLDVQFLNDRPVDEYITETNDIFDSGVIDSLIINGNLNMGNLLNLSKINGRDPDVLYTNKWKLDEYGTLNANIRFTENVTIDNLSATFINDINFSLLTSRLLYRNGNQTIPARFIFENLKAENLVAPMINNISLDLVNIRSEQPQKIIVPNGIIKFNSTKFTVLNAEKITPCNIEVAVQALRNPPTQLWQKIRINGNMTVIDEENILSYIAENVVLTNKKNIIKAPVYFSNVSVTNLLTYKNINGINLTEIFSDALLKESDVEQVVTGRINFRSPLRVYEATVFNNSDIPVVKDIELSKLFEQIIDKDEVNHIVIRGKKTFFSGLQTERLQSEKVSNISPENLVTIDNPQQIPSVIFESVEIEEDLTVNRINDQDFIFFLNERLLISGPPLQETTAIYSFNDVHIAGNITTPSINGINMEDIVLNIGEQEILSRKTFLNDVHISGNIYVERLNGYSISDIYEKALLRNQESYIEGNVEILKPSIVNGTITTEYINGYSVEKLRAILDTETKHKQTEEIENILRTIGDSVKLNLRLVKKIPSEVMYLERSNVVQLSFPNTIDAQVFRLKDYILIHIIGEQEGNLCGLPEKCKCPVQYTIQISPELSINSFVSKSSQRIYSYDDGFMTIHLVTDTVSTDATCRTNNSQSEHSTLTWNTITSENVDGGLHSHPIDFTGYISAVEYFSLNGNTYVIVGRYYDPMANSYNLDCVIYKFSKDKTFVEEIQRIKTNGVWSLKIFTSDQGINLIVGMLADGNPERNAEKTLLMKFDKNQEKFSLMREVQAYGCISSVGIILEMDMFIVLAHKIHPILIFKYDNLLENYVFYQNLWDPLPVSGISLFYAGGFGIDPYLSVVSESGAYNIYTYTYTEGWQRKFHGIMRGLRNLVPFELNEELYLFAPSTNMSSVLTVVKFDSK